jgi:hypothetical protein
MEEIGNGQEKYSHREMAYLVYFGTLSIPLSISGSYLALILMAALFLKDTYQYREIKRIPKDFLMFIAVYGWKGVSTIVNGVFSKLPDLGDIVNKVAYLLIGCYKIGPKRVEKSFHILFGVNSFVIIYGLLQKYFNVPAIFQELFTTIYDERFIGYYGHPLHYGGVISLVIITCFAITIYHDGKFGYYLPILLTGLAMSGSRSYFLGVAGAILIITIWKSRKVFITTMISIPIFFLTYSAIFPTFKDRLLNRIEFELVGRSKYWEVAWDTFKENPFFGVGYEQFTHILRPLFEQRLVSLPAHAHNLYLQELAEGGLVGFILIVYMVVYFSRKYFLLFREEKSNSLLRAMYVGLLGCFINLALAGIFEYNFGAAMVWIQFTFLMGVTEALRKWTKETSLIYENNSSRIETV